MGEVMLNDTEIKKIASMHISPRLQDVNLKKPLTMYHFFLDKVRLFYSFDPNSIIVEMRDGNIAGVLIYTYDDYAFSKFAGLKHFPFYIRLFKTLFFYYGFDFKKFFLAAKSMLGKNTNSDYIPDEKQLRAGKIWVLLVLEEYRRQGISLKLLNECIKQMRDAGKNIINVTVKKDNEPAVNVYKKFGFKIVGTCTESSGDSFIMQYEII